MAPPLPICFLNGEYLPLEEARISPLDRGFLFADSVYEVLPVFGGRPYRFAEHFDRLARSLNEIGIASPHTHSEWLQLLNELTSRNSVDTYYVYIQVTRGAEFGRNHAFPPNAKPTVFAMCSPLPPLTRENREQGLSAITVEDFRWRRCDIKSTMLLANVLMKQEAFERQANEAIIVSEGQLLEGAATSVFVIINGTLATPPNSRRLLPGTTRDAVIELAQGHMPTRIRPISVDELVGADELWVSAATRDVLPITILDGKPIGNGKPGAMWKRMIELFADDRKKLANTPAYAASNSERS
jgi:D-alanine transaminase